MVTRSSRLLTRTLRGGHEESQTSRENPSRWSRGVPDSSREPFEVVTRSSRLLTRTLRGGHEESQTPHENPSRWSRGVPDSSRGPSEVLVRSQNGGHEKGGGFRDKRLRPDELPARRDAAMPRSSGWSRIDGRPVGEAARSVPPGGTDVPPLTTSAGGGHPGRWVEAGHSAGRADRAASNNPNLAELVTLNAR